MVSARLMPNEITASPTLNRVRAAGVLRVGTTGDYTPFSLKRPDGSYEGADIEMAHDLAERLGVRATFVPTIWVELLDGSNDAMVAFSHFASFRSGYSGL